MIDIRWILDFHQENIQFFQMILIVFANQILMRAVDSFDRLFDNLCNCVLNNFLVFSFDVKVFGTGQQFPMDLNLMNLIIQDARERQYQCQTLLANYFGSSLFGSRDGRQFNNRYSLLCLINYVFSPLDRLNLFLCLPLNRQ